MFKRNSAGFRPLCGHWRRKLRMAFALNRTCVLEPIIGAALALRIKALTRMLTGACTDLLAGT
jgi:hypothetical protein